MIRREFMKLTTGSFLIALGGSVFLVSCGEGTAAPVLPKSPLRCRNRAAPRFSTRRASTTLTFTPSRSRHRRSASPPADGVAGSTSNDDGHTHTVAVSMADLQSVAAGQTIKVTTGTASSDTHVLTLVKIA